VELINSINPEWKDLYNEVMSWWKIASSFAALSPRNDAHY
jgi:hypothetical protein